MGTTLLLRRRRLATVLFVVLLAACRMRPDPSAERPVAAPRIELVPAAADVFAYRIDVRLITDGSSSLTHCRLLAAGQAVAIQPGATQRMPLRPGVNSISAECQSEGRTLRSAVARYTVKLDGSPTLRGHLTPRPPSLELDGTAEVAYPGAPELRSFEWFALDDGPAPTAPRRLGEGLHISQPLPTRDGDHVFMLRVRDAAGRDAETYAVLRVERGVAHEKQPGEPPAWLEGGVIYGVIPPLWGTPALAAVTAGLDRLQELGVTALWLSPLFATPSGDFGYAVTDAFHVRADYGDSAALRTLVEQAHRRALRVLLDLVPNHTSAQHPYFREARALGTRSHYWRFYDRDEAGTPTHYFDWTHLPNLDYGNPEVARFTLESALHWLRTAQIDGYRVDAAWGIQQRAPRFWPHFTRALQAARPKLWLLAEASAHDPAYLAAGFDAAYDWTAELGHHAWEHVFDPVPGIAQRLIAAVLAKSGTAPERVFRFLNNNDTGARFITRHGEPLTRVATAALLTLPGVPCIYAFDEEGAEYEPYKTLAPIQTRDPELHAFHRRLIGLRRSEPAFHSGRIEVLHASAEDEALVYLRESRHGDRLALVALNFSARPVRLRLARADAASVRWSNLRDALGAGSLQHGRDAIELELKAWATHVFVPQ